jgi:hypothetical protein
MLTKSGREQPPDSMQHIQNSNINYFWRFTMEEVVSNTDRAGQSTGTVANDGTAQNNRLVPKTQILSHRRKMNGTARRITTLIRDIEKIRAKLSNKTNRLSLAERRLLNTRLLNLEFEFEVTRDAYREESKEVRNLSHINNTVTRKRLADYRAERRLMSRVRSFTDDVMASIDTEVMGVAVEPRITSQIAEVVLHGDRDKFDEVLSALVRENKPKLWKEMVRFEAVKRAVFRNVWETYESVDIVLGERYGSSTSGEERK